MTHNTITITALVNALGDENLRFQNLDHCYVDLDWSIKRGMRVTFGTEVKMIPGEGMEKLGLILWLDRKLVDETMARLTMSTTASQSPPESDKSREAISLSSCPPLTGEGGE